jgi:hypothetical protein
VTSGVPAASTDDSIGGACYGRNTRRISSADLWVEVLATAGPRIVRLGRAGSSRNLLAETPGAGWETPHGRCELFGPAEHPTGLVPSMTLP